MVCLPRVVGTWHNSRLDAVLGLVTLELKEVF